MITKDNIITYEKVLNPTREIYTIIANLCNNPKLIINPDYKLSADDFPDKFHKIVFASINNLANNSIHLEEITAVDIDNYLSDKPDLYKIWRDTNGIKYIMDTKELSNDGLFEYSYHKVKKHSLLREMLKNGFDISEIYPIDDMNIITESAEQLDNMTESDIIEYYTNKIIDVRNNWNIDSGTMEDFTAGDDLEGLFEELKEEPDVGYPFSNGYYNTLFRGMRESKYMLRSARSGFGKAVDNETVIPTTDGFKKVGEVKYGDYLYDRLGRPTEVIGVYPHKNKKAYKVTLSDGRSFIACDEHLVPYIDSNSNTSIMNKPLGDMLLDYKDNNSFKYKIPNNKFVEFKYKEILIPAYILGKVIGRVNMDSHSYEAVLKLYGENTVKIRIEFLKGLLDSIGNVLNNEDGYFYRLNIGSEELKNCIIDICHSLGYGVFSNGDCNGVDGCEIDIYTPDILVTKNELLDKIDVESFKSEKHLHTYIVDIAQVESRDMTCFTVDNEESLFLINDYIVTHNTRLAVRDLLDVSCSEIYRNARWESLGPSMPSMLISTELKKRELQLMMLAYISGIDQNIISDGSYDEGTRKRLMKAMQVIQKAPFFVSVIEDFSASDIEMKIEEYIIGSNVKFVSFDYIQVTPKLVASSKKQYGTDRREDLILVELSAALKRIANKHDVYIMSGTQLNDNWEFREKRNEACLRGSKAIADKVDHGVLTFGVDSTDISKLKNILDKNEGFANKQPNYSHWIYKNRSGAKDVVIWSRMDLGTIREEVLFVTDYQYNLIDMEQRVIEVYDDGKEEEDDIIF